MVKIKICGLFREADIDFVNEARPDYIGFVFAKSRRQVSADFAAKLRERLAEGIMPVGVFVNAPLEEILSLYQKGVIAMVQLHGGEDAGYIAALKKRCAAPVIQALCFEPGNEEARILSAEQSPADYLLLDHGSGGTGTAFDWSIINALQDKLRKPWFLAGGIDSHTIAEAVSLHPFGVDVSSGAETNGIKDRDTIIHLVQTVRKHNSTNRL